MPNGADRLLEWLAELGVEVIFGNPGSTELPLIDALARQRRVRYVLGLHEATVVGMADGYAQRGDRIAAVNVHVQPGLMNGLSGVLNAARARVPLLVTVGQQVTTLKDDAPFLGGELVALAKPIAKSACEVTLPEHLPSTLADAIEAAMGDPRGPVVVSLPMDVLIAPSARWDPPAVTGVAALLSADHLGSTVSLLAAANSPALLVGDGVAHARADAFALTVAERIGAPIYGEPFAARQAVPSRHPLWRGTLPGFASEIRERLQGHDVVLAVGMPLFRLFGASEGAALPTGVRVIHVDVDPAEVGRTITPTIGAVAPIDQYLAALVEALPDPVSVSAVGRRHDLERTVRDERTAAAARLSAAADGEQITPAFLCRAIADAVTPDDLIVDEALTSGRWLRTALIDRNGPDNWLAHRGSALGWGLPAAVGAKLVEPSRRVMCVHGDGSFLFGVHALWTAARERLPLAVVVADNGGYEILRAGLEGLTGRSDAGWPGLDLTGPSLDLVAISTGFGADAQGVERRDELAGALDELWRRADSGPAVLVVSVGGRTPPVGYPL